MIAQTPVKRYGDSRPFPQCMRPSSKALLAYAGVPALLVTDLTNIRYITGLELSWGMLLALPKGFVLYVDPRYAEMAHARAKEGIIVKDAKAMEADLKRLKNCGFEEEHVSVARMQRWKKAFKTTKFVPSGEAIGHFRRQKDDDELQLLKRAERITKEMLRRVPSALRKGTTERDIGWKLETWARELGADKVAFEPIVAFGTHTSRPHHRPTMRALRKGDMVQIDVGAVAGGYCADMAAVFFTAALTPEQERMYRVINEAKDAALDAIRPGALNADLDKLARDILEGHGYKKEEAMPHALGHGVGLEVHEGVTLSSRGKKEPLLEREVLAVEPGIYLPGKFGMREEQIITVR